MSSNVHWANEGDAIVMTEIHSGDRTSFQHSHNRQQKLHFWQLHGSACQTLSITKAVATKIWSTSWLQACSSGGPGNHFKRHLWDEVQCRGTKVQRNVLLQQRVNLGHSHMHSLGVNPALPTAPLSQQSHYFPLRLAKSPSYVLPFSFKI